MERKNRPRGSVKKTEVLEQRISREFREGNLQHVTVVLFPCSVPFKYYTHFLKVTAQA